MKKRNFPRWEYTSESIIEFMGSGYIGISFIGLLAECDEHIALDINVRRVNVINLKDAQKKLLENWSLVLAAKPDLAKRILWLVFLGKLMNPGRVDCSFSRS